MKLSFLILSLLVSAVSFADEIPNNSYPLSPYARCEKKGDKHDWAYYVFVERSDQTAPTQVYNDRGQLVDEEGSLGNIAIVIDVRELVCDQNAQSEYRWYPLRRDVESRVQVICKKGGGVFGIGKYTESFSPIPYGPVAMPYGSRTPEYNDYWGQLSFAIPIEKCLDGDQKKAFARGEEVRVEYNTRYAPHSGTGQYGSTEYIWSNLEVATLNKKK